MQEKKRKLDVEEAYDPIQQDAGQEEKPTDPPPPTWKLKTMEEIDSSPEWDELIEKENRIFENKTCRGRCYQCLVYFWIVVLWFEHVFENIIAVTACAAAFFFQISDETTDKGEAFFYSWLLGVLVGALLRIIAYTVYYETAVKVPKSKRKIRNDLHGFTICGYLFNLVLFFTCMGLLISIGVNCPFGQEDSPCHLRDVLPRNPLPLR